VPSLLPFARGVGTLERENVFATEGVLSLPARTTYQGKKKRKTAIFSGKGGLSKSLAPYSKPGGRKEGGGSPSRIQKYY